MNAGPLKTHGRCFVEAFRFLGGGCRQSLTNVESEIDKREGGGEFLAEVRVDNEVYCALG